ncbi:nuclear factor of activated T-cells 5 isoform X5 [Calliphora vicina]|uniref:nuclear factor of activated T-cells 5 isoform X5 n=1 Tax=Calliphora vicina TaxID=7373 RepID=UPI00325B6090
MLLKFTKTSGTGAGSSSSTSSSSMAGTYIARGTGMRTTMSTMSTMSPRIHRKGFRTPSKRHPGKAFPGKLHSVSRIGPGKMVPGKRFPIRPHPPPCDNSNDSGFGFDQHVEVQQQQQQQQQHSQHQQQQQTSSPNSSTNLSTSSSSSMHHHSHHHNNSHHQQQSSMQNSPTSLNNNTSSSSSSATSLQHSPQQHLIRAIPASRFIAASARGMSRVAHKRQPATPPNSVATSSNGRIQLEIVSQPEQQHRARYQTEGSRGAVKDRSGNGFPIVRLNGYNKSTSLQVFIGTDIGRVAPHMFYQACKVAGKNSTQCNEKKVDGTVVIEIDFKPDQDMTITCDCVGILKERNVDVEHRFPEHLAQKNKKKSTRCRMVFRTQLAHDDGTVETLQVCSNPIICTQPPGVPEICKKSLNSCPVDGGLELFIIGKNFLKDTHVIFQETYDSVNNDDDLKSAGAPANDMSIMGGALWEQTVLPDKEYLQQTHLICTVPPYIHQNIMKPVTVQVAIISSGKKSEPHTFVYTPKGTYTPLAAATTLSSTNTIHSSLSSAQDGSFMDTTPAAAVAAGSTGLWPPTETKHEIDADMMPPPITTHMPMVVRRPSLNTTQPLITDQQLVHLNAVVAAEALKTELLDESSQNSLADAIHSPESVVAACGVGGPQSPTALQYHSRYGRKGSLDAIMYDNNSMQGFPVAPAAPTTTPMEVAVAAAVEMAVKNEIAKAVSVAKVDKFITDLAKSANVADATDPVQEPSLFGVTNNAAIDHALTDILTTPQSTAVAAAAAAAVVLERSLSNSSASSSSASGSPMSGTSPSNSLSSHNSPITQDIILNSEPSVQLTPTMPLQQLMPNGSTASGGVNAEVSQTAGLSTDIIMNPSVSPSTILCSDNGAATAVVPNIMAPHQVTMANSILNDIAMQAQPTQQDAAVAALALSNIIMTPPSDTTAAVPPTPASMQPEVTTATSTAVSNMIIKAAADFISNQEQQTQHHHHCHTSHQSHSPQQQIMSSQTVTADPLSCNPLNLLLNHSDVVPTTQANVTAANGVGNETVSSQFPSLGITTPPQESLIVALATENALQKSVAAAAITTNGAVVTQETAAPPTPSNLHPVAAAAVGAVAAAAAAAAVAPLAPIPQDLTTMSDQDLLSYINPSTFDQVSFYNCSLRDENSAGIFYNNQVDQYRN